jgi:hypothetical protein
MEVKCTVSKIEGDGLFGFGGKERKNRFSQKLRDKK